MYQGMLHFTVCVWNRFTCLKQFLRTAERLYSVDQNIRVHVCAFEGTDASQEKLREAVRATRCPTEFVYRWDEFGNGLGHNTAAASVPANEMLVFCAVDIELAGSVLPMLRTLVRGGETFFRPKMGTLDAAGKRVEESQGYSYGLLACMKSDYLRAGGLTQRAMWRGEGRNAAEDERLSRALEASGMLCCMPVLDTAFARFHPRDPEQEFYRLLRSPTKRPWPQYVLDSVEAARRQKTTDHGDE